MLLLKLVEFLGVPHLRKTTRYCLNRKGKGLGIRL